MDANWANLVKNLAIELPKFKVVKKADSRLMWFLNFFVQLWNPWFMDRYTVTIGYTIYMPDWLIGTTNGYAVLRHEAQHMRDSKRFGILYWVSYFTPPIGPSFKAFWEWRGYLESMRVQYELHGNIPDRMIEFWVDQFTASSYLWMFPFRSVVRGWFIDARQRIMHII